MIPVLTYLRNGLCSRVSDRIILPISSFLSRFESPLLIQQSYEKLQALYRDEGRSCLVEGAVRHINDGKSDYEFDVQVVIPVYNSSSTLRQAIDSVVNQKGNLNIQITVVNDGSTDNSAEILEEYKPINNIEVITQQNKGYSGARNAALKQIKGKYITFLDSDDYMPENALISLFEMAEKTGCDIVQGAYICVGKTEKEICVPTLTENGSMTGFPWGKLFKSYFFKRFCFPDGYWFEDSLMGLVLFALTPVEKKASVSTPVYYYRNNPDGISNTAYKSPKVIDTVYVTRRLYEDRGKIGMPPADYEYDTFLRQTIINLKRVRSHGDKEMLKLAFCAMNDLKDKYFPNVTEPRSRLRYLHRALTNRRFRQCMRLIDFL